MTQETTGADTGDEVEMTVVVYAAPDEQTAEIVRGALEAEGVPAVIGDQVAGSLEGALEIGEGYWGEVRVAAHDEARARELLSAFEAGQGTITEADLDAQAQAASDPRV